MVKVQSVKIETIASPHRTVLVSLIADSSAEVDACGNSGANVVGLTADDTMSFGSTALCADGSFGILDSAGNWNW